MRLLIPTCLLLFGCAGDGATTDTVPTGDSGTSVCVDDWQPVQFADEGDVCFGDVATASDITVEVTASACLSSSCDQGLTGSCTLTDDGGGGLTLTSDLSWETQAGDHCDCTSDCGIPQTTCTLPGGLPDGDYTVTFGAETLTLTVPSSAPCTGF